MAIYLVDRMKVAAKGKDMPASEKPVEPTRNDLINWFKNARTGERCHVVTKDGHTYTHLTKFSPSMVKWQLSGFTGQDIDLSNTITFMELLQDWRDVAVGQAY